jgi:Protein of unknown function (DUF664)
MTPVPRPPYATDERTSLLAFLEVQRAVIRWKVGGIDAAAQRGVATPSGMTLLGMVRHLTDVERWWFRDRWAGEDVDNYYDPAEDGADFRVPADATVDGTVREYQEACAESNALIAAAESLDVPGKRHEGTLRWVITHLLEETARHAGHADLLREELDGATGYLPD